MKFRFKAFGLHLLGSACVLALLLGALYLGWYRWPGWYLTGGLKIAVMMMGFDVILGPLLTLIIANPVKPRRELARDIGIIICVQIIAAGYGATTLWNGRVVYYVYSQKYLETVQASDLDADQLALAEKLNSKFALHWYSLPRWIYAPLPQDAKLSQQIVDNAVGGGTDVTQMPRYYQPWEAGSPQLRRELKVVDQLRQFSPKEVKMLAERMKAQGFDPHQPTAIAMTGRTGFLLAVVDRASARVKALISVH